MSIDTTHLLNTCLEIEGLLCLVERRGESIPDNVSQLLMDKVRRLNADMADFTAENTSNPVEPVALHVPELAENPETVQDEDQKEIAAAVELEEQEDAEPEPEPVKEPERQPVVATRNDTVPVELTVNDKFRFRRELFANSDVDLAEALQIAGQMSTVEEIEDYFYNDLCFDPESDVVKDFMKVVTKHVS